MVAELFSPVVMAASNIPELKCIANESDDSAINIHRYHQDTYDKDGNIKVNNEYYHFPLLVSFFFGRETGGTGGGWKKILNRSNITRRQRNSKIRYFLYM